MNKISPESVFTWTLIGTYIMHQTSSLEGIIYLAGAAFSAWLWECMLEIKGMWNRRSKR